MSLRKITLAVLSIHSFFLLAIFLSPAWSLKARPKPLVVKTFIAPLHTDNKSSAQIVSNKSTPQPKSTPVSQTPKQASPKPPSKKAPPISDRKPSVKKQTPPAKKRSAISDTLQKELEASIAKIDGKKEGVPIAKTKTPIPLQIDQVDPLLLQSTLSSSDTYTDLLIQYLYHSLHLPEIGEVKIQLTLRQDGSVAKLMVLKTESQKNRLYLEENIPRLTFPSLSLLGKKTSESTFVLTFCNE